MSIQEEQQLLFDLRQGDEKAFNTIFSMFYENMIFTAFRMGAGTEDSKDIVMEAFGKAWIKRESFYTLYKLKCYIYVVVKHAIFQLSEKRIKFNKLFIPEKTYENEGLSKLINQDDKRTVAILTKGLNKRELAIIDICFAQEQKPRVASKILNLPQDNVRVFKSRALKQMKEKLKSHI